MKVAIAADHAGLALRDVVVDAVTTAGHEPIVLDVGAAHEGIDYPDVAIAVGAAIAVGSVIRGVLLCGSGAGVTVAANRLPLVRAALAHEPYTARQMVEHDHVNVLTIGARVIGPAIAAEVVATFLSAEFSAGARHARRLAKVLDLERTPPVNAPQQLAAAGQSLWLDNIAKRLISTGTLARYISDLAVTGVTSNPSILEKAISGSSDYDDAICHHTETGKTDAEELAFALALDDIVGAADLLRPVFDATGGTDGYVSIEVSPSLADDSGATIAAGTALHTLAARPNVLIKVPGTTAGIVAVEELIARGIPVNVTLLFSPDQYRAAAGAYLRGIERRVAAGKPAAVGSVASVFVSRWDSAADPALPEPLRDQLGIAVVQACYAAAMELLATDRWQQLVSAGALPQRLLVASTSTKSRELPDTYYVGRLAAPGTIDTIPEATLLAFAAHGQVCDLLQPDAAAARAVFDAVTTAGLDVSALAAKLQADGADAFRSSWAALLRCIDEKRTALVATVGS